MVVLDPVDPERAVATPLDLDLTLQLGDDVRLNGFGLDGTLDGSLHVRQRPGREMLATGTLDVGGRYTAYGQKLDITRGRLVWSNTAIADPLLDIRAERRSPMSPPASRSPAAPPTAGGGLDRSGDRPIRGARLPRARAAAVARRATRKAGSWMPRPPRCPRAAACWRRNSARSIGLDEAGVLESRALGGSVFGVGKYLSPKLYVGYGVSLLGTGQVLTLKYLLRKGFDIEIESSTVENRGSVNWRKEK